MIVKEFMTAKGRVRIIPIEQYITIMYPCESPSDTNAMTVPWDKLEDFQFLTDQLSDCTVGVFLKIVQELGTMHRQASIYKALI